MNVSDPDRPLDLLVYHQYSESYRGSDGTFKNLNTFLKITNITVDSTLVQSSIGHYAAIDLTVVQSLIRRLCNRQWTLMQPFICRFCNCRFGAFTTKSTSAQTSI